MLQNHALADDFAKLGDEGREESTCHCIEEQSYETKNSAIVKTKSLRHRQTWIWLQVVLFINCVNNLKHLSPDFCFEEEEQQHYLPVWME